MKRIRDCNIWIILLCSACLAACSRDYVKLDSPEHDDLIRADIAKIQEISEKTLQENIPLSAQKEGKKSVLSLSLNQAIKIGIQNNLDARVAALELLIQEDKVTLTKLKALPGLSLSGNLVGRSNDGASSSESVLSGTQSLEPSQSTEENRKTAELRFNWDILNAALAFYDAKTISEEASITKERLHKVKLNIERDIYFAFYRALSGQQTYKQTQYLSEQGHSHIKNLEKAISEKLISQAEGAKKIAAIHDVLSKAEAIQSQLQLAEIELKSLLSLPASQEIKLLPPSIDAERQHAHYIALLQAPTEELEWEALQNRAEIREEVLRKNMSIRNTKREILTTFPGLSFIVTQNYDGNKFIEDVNWGTYTATITQSIFDVLTLGSRLIASKSEQELSDVKRLSLTLAIMAQVHISSYRMHMALKKHKRQKDKLEQARRQAYSAQKHAAQGYLSVEQALMRKLESHSAHLEEKLSASDLQDSYAAFLDTLGRRMDLHERPVMNAALESSKQIIPVLDPKPASNNASYVASYEIKKPKISYIAMGVSDE